MLVLAIPEAVSHEDANQLAADARKKLAEAGRDAVVVIAVGCTQALWITDSPGPLTGQTPPGGSLTPPTSGE
jgi:hypothetical protein